MTIRLGLQGASGRMGSLVLECLGEFPEFELSAALVAPQEGAVGRICVEGIGNKGREVRYSSDAEAAVGGSDVFIDFSSPEAAMSLARLCASAGKRLVLGTTGFSQNDVDEIGLLAEKTGILLSPNMSIGMLALREACLSAQKILGEAFEIEVFELHHGKKRDAPSGTALGLGDALSSNVSLSKVVRTEGPRGKSEIGFSSARGGDVVGDHTVYFLGSGERLELVHRATNRSVFARGALRAALALMGRDKGLFRLQDLVSG